MHRINTINVYIRSHQSYWVRLYYYYYYKGICYYLSCNNNNSYYYIYYTATKKPLSVSLESRDCMYVV